MYNVQKVASYIYHLQKLIDLINFIKRVIRLVSVHLVAQYIKNHLVVLFGPLMFEWKSV
jgi:hypothetical protein